MKIAVVGLEYVGLPLSLQFARSCVSVMGLDVDAKKVQLLNNGQSYIRHIEPSAVDELVRSGKFSDIKFKVGVLAKEIALPCPAGATPKPSRIIRTTFL